MELKTILAILYANGMENVVSKAVAIDNCLDKQDITRTHLNVSINKDELPKDKQFAGDRKSGGYPCKIIGYDQYKLSDNYLVEKPNGKTLWKSLDDRYVDLVVVETIPHPVNA